MNEKQKFTERAYEKLVKAIKIIPEKDTKDIYALSFWYYCYNDDLRYPTITVSYNTTTNYKNNIQNASSDDEAKWNYAFWLQAPIVEIGGYEDKLLNHWFKTTKYYYTDGDDEIGLKDELLFKKILEKGGKFGEVFRGQIILLTKQLFSDHVIKKKFAKNIPILIHELEYGPASIDWTIKSNPKGLVNEFVKWAKAN